MVAEFLDYRIFVAINTIYMEVRAKKALGQHFLTDLSIARAIAQALEVDKGTVMPTLEVGPGMGVLTQYLLEREDVDLRMVEVDSESIDYLLEHFPQVNGKLMEADFLKLQLENFFPDQFCVIGNFPYNISSQIFFKVLDYKEQVPQVVGMVQKEVAERLASPPGKKAYGILSVLLQAWYDIEYLFTVSEHVFNPPPKVKSAVIRLKRNTRTDLGCDASLFKSIVKTSFNQRRKTIRNSVKPLAKEYLIPAEIPSVMPDGSQVNLLDMRPEQLSVEQFVELTLALKKIS
jgi:16S rRNA (adenine1518-N6/adenine1519-N6)-dimethyltransferase